jgi:hypothetical protein
MLKLYGEDKRVNGSNLRTVSLEEVKHERSEYEVCDVGVVHIMKKAFMIFDSVEPVAYVYVSMAKGQCADGDSVSPLA